jgi:hypothetical protein
VNGSVTTASDGYGLHFAKVESDGSIKHYLVGNDGVELTAYRGTISSSGTYPVLNVNAGKLRAVFNIGTEMKVYQSTDGGVNWNQINSQFTFTEGTINFIDATTDFYGTHIVWQDREQFTNNPRVFYYRWDDRFPAWQDYKNVSDLSASPSHKKPKVATTASEAQVAFLSLDQLTSRDLNLSNGQWDGSYAVASGNNSYGEALGIATIGSTLYTVIQGPGFIYGSSLAPRREIYFAYRDINSLSWTVDPSFLTVSHSVASNYRNVVAATSHDNITRVYYVNTCYADQWVSCNPGQDGVRPWTYTPGSGWTNKIIERRKRKRAN